jgi:hypothetical protein
MRVFFIALKPSAALTAPVVLALLGMLIVSCGTKIDTGRNAERKPDYKNTTEATTPASQEDAPQSSCFGSATESIPELETICGVLPLSERTHFLSLHDIVCNEKKLLNLFLPECGWQGQEQKPLGFLKVLDHTPLANTDVHMFYYLSAYSLTVKNSAQSLKDLLFFAFSDPAGFQSKYIFPKNTVVTPHASGVERIGKADRLIFDMDITGSVGSTRFVNEMRGYQASEKVEVVTERSQGPGEGINMRKSLQISKRLDDGSQKIVVLEEFEVPDRGLHDIALKVLRAHDVNRMKLFMDNAGIKP